MGNGRLPDPARPAPAVVSRHPPMQPGWIDRPHQSVDLGDLRLESGETLLDVSLTFVVHGPQPRPGDAWPLPVVLVVPAIASSHHRLDFLIGPGRALDPARCSVIAVDAIGNGLATSPSNSTAQAGRAFPRFSIRDLVASQAALLARLGVDRLAAVVGASMGGMQALQWAVSRPLPVGRVVAMTPMARTTAWSVAVNEASRRALAATGFACWDAWVPLMQLLMVRTPRRVDADFAVPSSVIDWIAGRTDWWQAQQVDPVDWLYQSWAYDAHDVGTTPGFDGDTAAALASIEVPVLVAAPALDLYNPVDAARAAADGIRDARFVALDGDWGHQAATAADAASVRRLDGEIRAFLAAGG